MVGIFGGTFGLALRRTSALRKRRIAAAGVAAAWLVACGGTSVDYRPESNTAGRNSSGGAGTEAGGSGTAGSGVGGGAAHGGNTGTGGSHAGDGFITGGVEDDVGGAGAGAGAAGLEGGTAGADGSSVCGIIGGSGGAPSGGAGMGGSLVGSGGLGQFACDTPVVASCNRLESWGTFMDGAFGGRVYAYGDLTFDASDSSVLHVTGTVDGYGGFGIYFNACSTLAAYTGVSFTLAGTIASVDHPNQVRFSVQSNVDYPFTGDVKGGCVQQHASGCRSPSVAGLTTSDAPQSVAWTDLSGGEPMATLDPTQVLGFQWVIDRDASWTPFVVDLTLDNLTLIGGSGGP